MAPRQGPLVKLNTSGIVTPINLLVVFLRYALAGGFALRT